MSDVREKIGNTNQILTSIKCHRHLPEPQCTFLHVYTTESGFHGALFSWLRLPLSEKTTHKRASWQGSLGMWVGQAVLFKVLNFQWSDPHGTDNKVRVIKAPGQRCCLFVWVSRAGAYLVSSVWANTLIFCYNRQVSVCSCLCVCLQEPGSKGLKWFILFCSEWNPAWFHEKVTPRRNFLSLPWRKLCDIKIKHCESSWFVLSACQMQTELAKSGLQNVWPNGTGSRSSQQNHDLRVPQARHSRKCTFQETTNHSIYLSIQWLICWVVHADVHVRVDKYAWAKPEAQYILQYFWQKVRKYGFKRFTFCTNGAENVICQKLWEMQNWKEICTCRAYRKPPNSMRIVQKCEFAAGNKQSENVDLPS